MTVRIFDKQLELRDGAAAAITSTTAGAAVGIDLDVGMDFKIALNVTALDTADADETYVVSVEVDTASGFACGRSWLPYGHGGGSIRDPIVV